MKNTRTKSFTVVSSAMAVATMFLMGAGLSAAQKAGPAFRAVGTMRAPATNVQPYGGPSRHVSHGPAFSGASAPRIKSFSTMPHSSSNPPATRPGTTFPEVFVGETSRVPLDRQPDPSDIISGLDDTLHFPGYELIDEKYRGGPDRSPGGYAPDPKRSSSYSIDNQLSDISTNGNMWDAIPGTSFKAAHWGSQRGNPLIGDSTVRNSWPGFGADKDNSQGGDGKGSGGKDTGGKETFHLEKDSEEKTEEPSDTGTEGSAVEDGKDNSNGGEGDDGNDPDEMRSFARADMFRSSVNEALVAEVAEAMDIVSRDGSRGGNSRDSRGIGFTQSGTNTQNGMPNARDHRVTPRRNRPDVAESPVSRHVMANPMGQSASPGIGDDGGPVDPNPGPTAGSAAAPLSASGGVTMANPMGYAMSTAIGDGGPGPDNPDPGPR